MKLQTITSEQFDILKTVGFDNGRNAPVALALKWLREEHLIDVNIQWDNTEENYSASVFADGYDGHTFTRSTYEESEADGFMLALQVLINYKQ